MKADTTLQLGDFKFSSFEIPDHIDFGGEQSLAIHKLVGGGRVIDSMGRDNAPLIWSGLFLGENALVRARYLDRLRVEGKPLLLTWDELSFYVVIKSFIPSYERFYKIPYSITCEVVVDNVQPISSLDASGVDYWIDADMKQATAFGALIGDGVLSDALGALDTVISGVSGLANAVQSTINTVMIPVQAVTQRVGILIASTGNTIGNVTTLGGILPNNSASENASNLLGQVANMGNLPVLYNLQSVMGRMSSNLASVPSGGSSVTVAGGDLFSMAANAYGDAAEWTTIASANGLSDPIITGTQTINVPSNTSGNAGILNG